MMSGDQTPLREEGSSTAGISSVPLAHVWDEHWDLMGAGDRYGLEAEGFHYRLIRDWLRANTEFEGVQRVLEPGSGTGKTSFLLAKMGKEVHLLDFSRRACEAAGHGYAQEGVSARVIRGDALDLPYADDVFDLVWNHGVIEHFPDPSAVVREMQRVTRPNGWTVVLVPRSMSWWVLQKKIVHGLALCGAHRGWSRGEERSYTRRKLVQQLAPIPGDDRRMAALYWGNTFSLGEVLRGLKIPGLGRLRQPVPTLSPTGEAGTWGGWVASQAGTAYRTAERLRRVACERIEWRIPAVGKILGQELIYAIRKRD